MTRVRILVVAIVVIAAGRASAEPCTLKQGVKVLIRGTWKPVAAGVMIEVGARGEKWTTVSTLFGEGKVATAQLLCADTKPAAPAPLATATPAPGPVLAPAPPTTPVSAPPPAAGPAATKPSAEPAAHKARRIAVYQVAHAGIDDRVATVVTDSVVAELRKLEKTSVVGMDEIKAMLDLEAQKQLAGCSDASCIAEIADSLGVDGVVIGNVAVVGAGMAFGLKHIDQHSAQTLAQSTRRIDSLDPADVLAAIGPEVQELFPDVPLKPGMTRGVAAEVALRIHPPPLKPWVFWSLTGVSAVALASGAAFTTWNGLAYQAADARSRASVKGPDADGLALQGDIANVRTSFAGLTVAYGAAAVVGVGAGVSLLFVDWSGAGDAE